MIVSDQWLLTFLVTRTIAILIAAACAGLAFVGAALAVPVAGSPEPQSRALTKIWPGYRRVATLPGGAVAVAAADTPISFTLAGLALIVVLADGADRQGAVSASLAAILPRDRCAAHLARWTIAVAAADAPAPFAMIRATLGIARARRADHQVGPRAEIPPDRRFEAAFACWTVPVLVALAGAAKAAATAALIVDTTSSIEPEIAAPDEWLICDKGCVCFAERRCPIPHHIDGIVVPDVAIWTIVVLKYREPVRMASLMDDNTD